MLNDSTTWPPLHSFSCQERVTEVSVIFKIVGSLGDWGESADVRIKWRNERFIVKLMLSSPFWVTITSYRDDDYLELRQQASSISVPCV